MTRYSIFMFLCAVGITVRCSKATGPYFHPIESVEENQAIIYLYRPPGPIGQAYSYPIFANGDLITALDDGGYFPYATTPGALTFSIGREAQGIRVFARKNTSHFVKLYIREKFNPFKASGDLILEEVHEKYGFDEIRDCRLMQP